MKQYYIDDFAVYEYPAAKVTEKKKQTILFFAHANGVPAQTYRTLFEKMVNTLNITVISYDLRGMGRTKAPGHLSASRKFNEIWTILLHDHIALFEKIKKQKEQSNGTARWFLGGHSIGAWLSLLSAPFIKIDHLLLYDPAILLPKTAMMWFFLSLFKKNELSPHSRKVKKRKQQFASLEEILKTFKRSSFMKAWPEAVIKDYIEGSFVAHKETGSLHLRHNPNWEGGIFEEYPPSASIGFLRIPWQVRRKITPIFFVGAKSDTCNPKAKLWVKLFFPKLQWYTIPEGAHMFPLEMQDQTVELLQRVFEKDRQRILN